MREKVVIVLDAERRFLEYTHPAMARRLLKEGRAVVYSKNPFAIQIQRSVEAPNRHTRNRQIMGQVKNFTDFFKDERDIYIQNISGCQVSLQFEVGGRTESFLVPNSKDPVNLTQFIPFASVKASIDLRRMLNRQPPALQLLNDEEYRMYFERQAQQQGLQDADEAMARAERRRVEIQNHVPLANAPDPIKLHDIVEDGKHLGERKVVSSVEFVSTEDAINPKVLNLCLQVSPQVPDQQKMTAVQLLTEIDNVGSLTLSDWEYIQSHGYYKSVKNHARKMVASLASNEEADDEAPVAKPVKKATKAKATKSAE
jgi:hypothetical protein